MVKGSRTSYANAKIYKLVDSDGYYYYGSTTQPLYKRLYKHKSDAQNRCRNQKVYKYFNEIGWNDVKIILVKDNLGVENIEQLLAIEDSFIKDALDDDHCLNSNRAVVTDQERLDRDRKRGRIYMIEYSEKNQEKIKQNMINFQKGKKFCKFCNHEMSNKWFSQHNKSIFHITNFILY